MAGLYGDASAHRARPSGSRHERTIERRVQRHMFASAVTVRSCQMPAGVKTSCTCVPQALPSAEAADQQVESAASTDSPSDDEH